MSNQNRVAKDDADSFREVAAYLEKENNRLLGVIENLQREKLQWKNDVQELMKDKIDLRQAINTHAEQEKRVKEESEGLKAKLDEGMKTYRMEKDRWMEQEKRVKEENEGLKAKLDEGMKTYRMEKDRWMEQEKRVKEESEGLKAKLDEGMKTYRMEKDRWMENLSTTQTQLTDLRQRLTTMASERMQTANPALEDLSDPHRPTELATRWEQLFRSGEYWVAYEEIHAHLKDEYNSTWMLYDLCKMVHDSCAEAVGEIMEIELVAVKAWLEEPAKHPNKMAFRRNIREEMRREMKKHTVAMPDALVRTLTPEEWRALSEDLVETCLRHCAAKVEDTKLCIRQRLVQHLSKKDPPPSLLQSIFTRLGSQMSQFVPQKKYKKFVEQVFHLCYRMLTREVPLAVRFDAGAGMTFDPSLYDNEQPEVPVDQSSTIDLVLRPPLLRYQGGPVLVKGLAQVVPPKAQPDGVSDEQDCSDRGRDDSGQVKPETTLHSPDQDPPSPGGDKSGERDDDKTDGDNSGERDGNKSGERHDQKTDGDKGDKKGERDEDKTDGDNSGERGGNKSGERHDQKTDGDKGDKKGERDEDKNDGDKSGERDEAKTADTGKAQDSTDGTGDEHSASPN